MQFLQICCAHLISFQNVYTVVGMSERFGQWRNVQRNLCSILSAGRYV